MEELKTSVFNCNLIVIIQNITPTRMHEMAEEFFLSLGFPKLPKDYFKNSFYEDPKDGVTKVIPFGTIFQVNITGFDIR